MHDDVFRLLSLKQITVIHSDFGKSIIQSISKGEKILHSLRSSTRYLHHDYYECVCTISVEKYFFRMQKASVSLNLSHQPLVLLICKQQDACSFVLFSHLLQSYLELLVCWDNLKKKTILRYICYLHLT